MADNNLKLSEIKVKYANGTEETFNLKVDLEDQVLAGAVGETEKTLKLATEEQIRALFNPTSN